MIPKRMATTIFFIPGMLPHPMRTVFHLYNASERAVSTPGLAISPGARRYSPRTQIGLVKQNLPESVSHSALIYMSLLKKTFPVNS